MLVKVDDLYSATAAVGSNVARSNWPFAAAANAMVSSPEKIASNRPKISMWLASARPSKVKMATTRTITAVIPVVVFMSLPCALVERDSMGSAEARIQRPRYCRSPSSVLPSVAGSAVMSNWLARLSSNEPA